MPAVRATPAHMQREIDLGGGFVEQRRQMTQPPFFAGSASAG
jgi:hypothetical protein